MSEGLTAEVSAGASPAAESTSPGTAAPDLGGSNEASTAGAQPSEASAQPVATNDAAADAGSAEQEFISDEELARVPNQWRSRFDSLRQGYRSLADDHKALKSQWGDLSYDQVTSDQQLLNGLYGVATDEQGNERIDEDTGLPIPSTLGFVSQLTESSPALVDQLFVDIASTIQSDGRSYAEHFFESLGLNVNDIQKYAELSANPQNVTSIQGGVITADELARIPETLHDIYKTLSPEDRDFALSILDDGQLERFMKDKERLAKFDQFEQQYEADKQEAAKRETDQFWGGVKQKQGEFKAQLWSEGLNSISKGIAEKVTFSADPAVNAVQTAAVKSLISIIADPNHAQVGAELAAALGVNLDSAFMQSLEAIGTHADNFVKLQQIAANPNMKAHRNDAQMKQAQAEMDSKYRAAMAKFNEVALKIAQAIAGGNQVLREATSAQLAQAKSRPTIGGARPAGNGTAGEKNPYRPFTKEALDWNRQRRSQLGQ